MKNTTRKTLADLKRTIKKFQTITLFEVQEKVNGTLQIVADQNTLNANARRAGHWQAIVGVPRFVTVVDTTGFYLNHVCDNGHRGSHCGWPSASRLSFAGNEFAITELDEYGEVWQIRKYRINQ